MVVLEEDVGEIMKTSITLKNFTNIFVFAITLLAAPEISTATIYYVATTGDDGNSGSESSPYLTIKHGVKNLSAGDTLYVRGGKYYESILSWHTKIPNGTSWKNPVTVAAYPGETVTITPPQGHAFFWIQDGQSKYLVIRDFIIDGEQKAEHGFKFSNNSRYIRVEKSEIKNTWNSGIMVSICSGCADPGSYPHDTYHEFVELNIHHCGGSFSPKNAHGFYIETSHNLVEKGKFHFNAGNGGKFFHGNLTGVANHNIARNNQFFNNGQSGKWSCGLILSSGDNNAAYNNIAFQNLSGFCAAYRVTNALLYNNISYENQTYGIYVGIHSTNGAQVQNNTVYKNGVYGIFVGDDAKNTKIMNNIAYLNGNNSSKENIELEQQSGSVIISNLTSDPMFENVQAKNFRLKPSSPGIDKGISSNLITTDMVGTSRPQGSEYDIGAFELIPLFDSTPPRAPQKVTMH